MLQIRVGDRVTVSDLDAPQRNGNIHNVDPEGTVRFVGEVDFDRSENRWGDLTT